MKTVAVLLSGCGYLDGAEIRESVLTLLALDSEDVHYKIFAPDKDQHHVVNHLTNEPSKASRNILVESARIARGDVQDISHLEVGNFDALIIPGGFGVAKNLCTFAFEGSAAYVDEAIAAKVKAFHSAKKPIGAICIAPALVAITLGKQSPTLTIGSDKDTAAELEKLGATHQNCDTSDCIVDETNKLVTTPAYMDDNARIAKVYAGISKLVKQVLQLA